MELVNTSQYQLNNSNCLNYLIALEAVRRNHSPISYSVERISAGKEKVKQTLRGTAVAILHSLHSKKKKTCIKVSEILMLETPDKQSSQLKKYIVKHRGDNNVPYTI